MEVSFLESELNIPDGSVEVTNILVSSNISILILTLLKLKVMFKGGVWK